MSDHEVPEGWSVVNPRHMADLKAALETVERVKTLAENGPFLTRWIDDSRLVDVADLRAAIDPETRCNRCGSPVAPSPAPPPTHPRETRRGSRSRQEEQAMSEQDETAWCDCPSVESDDLDAGTCSKCGNRIKPVGGGV